MSNEHSMRRVTAIRNVNVVSCMMSNCITSNPREPLPHRLKVTSRDPLELRCHYCGRTQNLDELVKNVL